MDPRLICQWLGLPAAAWPPDHYTLLGLPRGEADCARIEHHAQERLCRLRCYQITHPEQATEAMNRLAQAMVCLTDVEAKKRYDSSLGLAANGAATCAVVAPGARPAATATAPVPSGNGPAVAPPAPAAPVTVVAEETSVLPAVTQLDWSATPPPVRAAAPAEPASAAEAPAPGSTVPPPVKPAPAPPADSSTILASVPADPVLEAARSSPAARRGLGTRRALYERLLATRELVRLWDQAGRYVGKPKRRLARAAEESDLTRRLTRIDQHLLDFPPLLGQAGQPGYRLVMLAREEQVPEAFKRLSPEEREALALDWKTSRSVLATHLRFVRQRVRSLRRLSWCGKLLRPVDAWVNEHQRLVLGIVLALMVVGLFFFTGH
jgi:hypothetical protein